MEKKYLILFIFLIVITLSVTIIAIFFSSLENFPRLNNAWIHFKSISDPVADLFVVIGTLFTVVIVVIQSHLARRNAKEESKRATALIQVQKEIAEDSASHQLQLLEKQYTLGRRDSLLENLIAVLDEITVLLQDYEKQADKLLDKEKSHQGLEFLEKITQQLERAETRFRCTMLLITPLLPSPCKPILSNLDRCQRFASLVLSEITTSVVADEFGKMVGLYQDLEEQKAQRDELIKKLLHQLIPDGVRNTLNTIDT